MKKYLIIEPLRNSWGRGFSIHASIDTERGTYDGLEHCFYGYSERDAVRLWREHFGMQGRHFTRVYI